MSSPKFLEGSKHLDQRGCLNFFNSFDMVNIKRFYEIEPKNTEVIRAWQGHQKEQKWFYCHSGVFLVHLIALNNFQSPSRLLKSKTFELDAQIPGILKIPGGFVNGFKALTENSKMLVFSNFSLEQSKNDDFRYPLETWKVEW